MDADEYLATWCYRERMAEAAALAARRALLDSNCPPRRSAHDYLGTGLIGLARRMILGRAHGSPSKTESMP